MPEFLHPTKPREAEHGNAHHRPASHGHEDHRGDENHGPDQGTPFDAIFAARRPVAQSLLSATWFAAAAAICCALLYSGYALFDQHGVAWAVVSALLVLIPDVRQSVATALARVAANIIGAVAGLIVSHYVGEGSAAVILAVVFVGYVCHLLRLDLGVRTACVGVVIVMTSHPGEVAASSLSRFWAVMIGCLVGVSVQLLLLTLQRHSRAALRQAPPPDPHAPPGSRLHTTQD